jgi:hypothetical protein
VNRLNDALAQSPRFDGDVYQHAMDFSRLKGQILRVYQLMQDGRWRTLDEIAKSTGDPVASVSSQLRHLRKPRFGAHVVNRRSREGALFEYQLDLRGES